MTSSGSGRMMTMRDQQAHQQQPREEEPPQQLEVQGQIAAA